MTSLILDNGLPAPREVASAVFARTDGIPLHIEELLGALDTRTRMDGSAIREATVPDTIEDAVISRLGRRTPDAQAAARAGAVVGRSFDASTLAAVMDLPVEALDDPLQELVDSFILEPPTQRGTYDFRHQLLRDAVYRRSRPAIAADCTPEPPGKLAPRRALGHPSVAPLRARRTTRCRVRQRPRGRWASGEPVGPSRGLRPVSARRPHGAVGSVAARPCDAPRGGHVRGVRPRTE